MTERSDRLLFRRVVIGFQGSPDSRQGLEIAAQFASRFRSELHGIFVEDESLIEWCATNMARHYSRGSARPASVTPEMLTRDFTAAAAVARARLLNVARSLGLTMHFEVSRTGSALIDPDRLEPGDLLAVIEPADPLARSSHPFAALRARIAAANGPVLYVPHGAASRKGPVLSIAGDADRNDLELVEQMVRAFGDDIVLASEADLPRLKAETARERMIILRRGARILSDSAAFSALVAARRVPALIVGHPAGRSAEEESGPREAGNV